MSCKHYTIEVFGKVQGVWFRKYTLDKAKSMDLKGYVKNLENGNVFIEVEGDNLEKLQKFIDWLSEGSPLSEVEKVQVTAEENCKNYADFHIKK